MPSGDLDNCYPIVVDNKFGTCDSDIEDPYELILAAQEKPKKEKEPKVKGKKDVKPAKTTEKKTVKIETTTENENSENKRNDRPRNERGRGRGRGGRGGRGGERGERGGERGERGGRGRGGFRNNNFSPNNNNNQGGFGFDNNNQGGFGSYQTQVAETNEGGFGSGFGGNDGEERRGGRSGFRGSGRGGRGGRGRGRGGNREYDRRSGSDKSSVKPADKRDGSGSYNWGSPQDEINAASEENGGFGAPKETEETPAENVEQTQETEETPEVEPVDEGPQEMTFEEYRKQQELRKQPAFNLRKVESDKKGLKPLKKPTEKDNESSSSFFFPKKNVQETYKSSGRVKENLNVNIRYGSGENRHYDASRRGRGRGGRRGGRRDGEGNAKDATGYALTNNEEFPSL